MKYIPSVDVAIIGGGPAGTALALTLAIYSDLRVAVIEQTAYDNIRVGDNVSASLLSLLNYLQVKEPFLADNHQPVYNVAAVWGSSRPNSRASLFSQLGEGYLLDRGKFDAMLAEQLFYQGGKLLLETKCKEGERLEGGGWRLLLENASGESAWMETGYLVDATGRQSRITKRLGATSTVCDSLVGISAFLSIPEGQPKTEQILVESIPEGWWYSAWLPDGSLTVVLMTDIDLMRQRQLHQQQPWIRLLSQSQHISKIVQGGKLIYPLKVKPAYSQIVDCAVGEDWMAVGDAAAAFDPLSSMGIGHAMTSGSHAGVALIEYLNNNNEQLLQQYQRSLVGNFETYLQLRHMYYGLEKRWLEQPFWQRRTNLPLVKESVSSR